MPDEELNRLVKAYDRYVDQPDRFVIGLMRECLEAGMEAGVIQSAIRDTSRAARPSKRYLERILERYIDEHILTMPDLIRDRDRHEARIQSAKRRRYAQWYDDGRNLTSYDRACDDPFADPYDCDIDNFIPIQTTEYINSRKREILGDDRRI